MEVLVAEEVVVGKPVADLDKLSLPVEASAPTDWGSMVEEVASSLGPLAVSVEKQPKLPDSPPSVMFSTEGFKKELLDGFVWPDYKRLDGGLTQLKDVVDRLELIYNQRLAALEEQWTSQQGHQKRFFNAISELRVIVQALVAEVGEEAVNARVVAIQQQQRSRQHDVFHRDFTGQGSNSQRVHSFYGAMRGPRGAWNGNGNRGQGKENEEDGGEPWRRRARGGGGGR
jgi:hypothetical protein